MAPKSEVVIDRSSDLWKTCVHEAGHVIAREHFGFVVTRIVVKGPGSGWVHWKPSGRQLKKGEFKDTTWEWHGVACLAGFAAAEKLSWLWSPSGCEGDESNAKYASKVCGISTSRFRSNARSLISRKWKMTEAQAEKLYYDAIARGLKKNSWW